MYGSRGKTISVLGEMQHLPTARAALKWTATEMAHFPPLPHNILL